MSYSLPIPDYGAQSHHTRGADHASGSDHTISLLPLKDPHGDGLCQACASQLDSVGVSFQPASSKWDRLTGNPNFRDNEPPFVDKISSLGDKVGDIDNFLKQPIERNVAKRTVIEAVLGFSGPISRKDLRPDTTSQSTAWIHDVSSCNSTPGATISNEYVRPYTWFFNAFMLRHHLREQV